MNSEPAALPTAAVHTRSQQFHAVAAAFLGWTLDAFDFFTVVFLLDTLAAHFHVTKRDIVATTAATLLLRPVGALLFGLLADRFGRRLPLMANVLYFSLLALLCGFAPNYSTFFILRALYGIGMGGEWGVGASLALESVSPRWRGVLSGVLQSGYSIGYLLAAIVAALVLPHAPPDLGWRLMFWIGGVPALLALYIRLHVPESEAWRQHRVQTLGEVWTVVRANLRLILYLVLMMTFYMFLSHGTQDLYPDFLKTVHGFSQSTVSAITVLFNIGAVVGGVCFGHLSQLRGRRFAILCALALALCMIPLWAFGNTVALLAVGSFLMQVGVQGAWGVVPAHLNELSPNSVRGLVPGLAYQLGIIAASRVNLIEFSLQKSLGYPRALAFFEVGVILALGTVVALGREAHGKKFIE